jgi:hypothetical protein
MQKGKLSFIRRQIKNGFSGLVDGFAAYQTIVFEMAFRILA